jgi:hypothetical protein
MSLNLSYAVCIFAEYFAERPSSLFPDIIITNSVVGEVGICREWLGADVIVMTFGFLVEMKTFIFILCDEVPHAYIKSVVRK